MTDSAWKAGCCDAVMGARNGWWGVEGKVGVVVVVMIGNGFAWNLCAFCFWALDRIFCFSISICTYLGTVQKKEKKEYYLAV